ncbi:hypothetical protein GGI16_001413 [Coemansia sp. S142-1]|nr:hypothetical protein GGI16_001413 [Coemansia sp. S142-1]
MRTPSPFQILPLHIVEQILDYVVGSSRLKFDCVCLGSDEYTWLLMPLLIACPSFALPIFSRIFRFYSMELTGFVDNSRDMPPSLKAILIDAGYPAHLYAKALTVSVDVRDIYSGAALRVLSSEPYITRTFPMVRSISFLFSLPSATEQQTFIATTSPDAESNISAFVKRVKQIATKLEKIGIIISPHDNGPPSPVQQLNDLVQQLCQQAVDIEYEVSRQPVILDQRLNGLRNLVYVSFDSTDGGEQIVQLVRRNASTLQSLDVLESTLTNVNGLILNDDGGYMQYPCLHTLKFSGRRGPDVPRLLVFPGAVPFPNLRKLSIGLKCLFGDDTLFRGNAATLETLSLSPSPTSARVIREYRVFTPVSHPKLQYVRFGVSSDSEPNLFDTDVEYLRFVLSIGPNAHVRAIYDRFVGLEFQSLIPAFGEHTCIQVLALEGLHLNLWDAIALVTALPLLSDLRTLLPVLGPLPNGVAKHKLPAYVIANYAPTGNSFRCWSYGYNVGGNSFKEAVRCVLLLALVCPNFDYAAVGLSGELFMAHMKEMITTDGFRPYAARLRRLLFGGAKNKIRSVKGLLAAEEAARARWEGRV